MSVLVFQLNVVDEWPPVAKESMAVEDVSTGHMVIVPPFFLHDMSVGDVIDVDRDGAGVVVDWRHVTKSRRSTVWVLAKSGANIEPVLDKLKALGCNIERFEEVRYFAIDVPETCSLEALDDCLDAVAEDEAAIVFPSLRHPEGSPSD